MMKTQSQHRKQYGFFDLGIGLLLISIFGTTAVIVNETSQPDKAQIREQQDIPVALYCHQTGGSFLATLHKSHAVCCYMDKCIHIDSDRGISEILLRYKHG
jgi:hypothetical protein